MNRIQFFYDNDLVALQMKVNDWLSENRQVKIVETNLNSMGKPTERAGLITSEKHIFYILYSTMDSESVLPLPALEEKLPLDIINEHLQERQRGVA